MDAAIRGDASDASDASDAMDAKTAGCGGFAGTRRSRGVLSELERGHDLSDVGWLTAAMIGRARATARMHALGWFANRNLTIQAVARRPKLNLTASVDAGFAIGIQKAGWSESPTRPRRTAEAGQSALSGFGEGERARDQHRGASQIQLPLKRRMLPCTCDAEAHME